ncbi:MAG: hypothetical protein RLZZ522_1466 [Verrucomicrobiota bacterium]
MIPPLRSLFCAAAVIFVTPAAWAQTPAEQAEQENPQQAAFDQMLKSLDWKSEGAGDLGGRAALTVPSGFRFTGSSGTVKLMEAYGNLTNGSELGYISPDDMSWFAVFEFDDCGYVKDDEKNKLDGDAILKQMKEAEPASNKRRAERGMSPMHLVGWHTPPFYNPKTNNLEWAIRLSSDGGEMINYKTKLLGRRGVMDVVLVCDEEQMATVVPAYQELLKGFSFNKEENYASFSKGDKVAEYGLTGLILGGGLLVAAKSGLLAKLWKPIAIGLVAIGAFFKRIFTGRTKESI